MAGDIAGGVGAIARYMFCFLPIPPARCLHNSHLYIQRRGHGHKSVEIVDELLPTRRERLPGLLNV